MIFGYLYGKKMLRQNTLAFAIWVNLAKRQWYQTLNIPMHVFKGIYYKYSCEQIREFCA